MEASAGEGFNSGDKLGNLTALMRRRTVFTGRSFSYENPLRARFGLEYFQGFPDTPGVYFFLDSNAEILYIGKSNHLRRRLMSYQSAKPGQCSEHILEMIELAHEIRFEVHKDDETAILREMELIRTLQPPFNIVGADPTQFLYFGILPLIPDQAQASRVSHVSVDFRLSHSTLDSQYKVFGCFPYRGKTKAGYSALLRLMYASTCERERFHLPAKICRTSPAYAYRGDVPREWLGSLEDFLSGRNTDLLKQVTLKLLENENLPKYLYAPLQRDIKALQDFYEAGPILIQSLRPARKTKKSAGASPEVIHQEQMQKLLAAKITETLKKKTKASKDHSSALSLNTSKRPRRSGAPARGSRPVSLSEK